MGGGAGLRQHGWPSEKAGGLNGRNRTGSRDERRGIHLSVDTSMVDVRILDGFVNVAESGYQEPPPSWARLLKCLSNSPKLVQAWNWDSTDQGLTMATLHLLTRPQAETQDNTEGNHQELPACVCFTGDRGAIGFLLVQT